MMEKHEWRLITGTFGSKFAYYLCSKCDSAVPYIGLPPYPEEPTMNEIDESGLSRDCSEQLVKLIHRE